MFNNSPVRYDGNYLYLKNNFQNNKIKSNIIIKSIGRNRQNIIDKEPNNLIKLPIYKNINEGIIYSKNLFLQIMNQINSNKVIKKNDFEGLNSCIKTIQGKKRIIYKDDWFKINEYEKKEGLKRDRIRQKIIEKEKVFQLL